MQTKSEEGWGRGGCRWKTVWGEGEGEAERLCFSPCDMDVREAGKVHALRHSQGSRHETENAEKQKSSILNENYNKLADNLTLPRSQIKNNNVNNKQQVFFFQVLFV